MGTAKILRRSSTQAVLTALLMLCFTLGGIDRADASADFPPDCAPLGPYACSSMQAPPFEYTWQPNCDIGGSNPTEAAAVAQLTGYMTRPDQCSLSIAPSGPWMSTLHFTIWGCAVIVWNGPLPWIDAGTGIELYNGHIYDTRLTYTNGEPTCAYTSEGRPVLIRSRHQSCPPGMGIADYNGKRYCRGDAVAKALGEPQQCSAVGNPIHFANGNKYQRESDYAGAGGPLIFERHYNNIAYPAYASDQFTAIGKLWRHTYDRWITEVVTTSLTTANVYRADGKVFSFNLYNGAYYGDKDVRSKLTRLYDNGTPVGWKYVEQADDSEETYNNEGRLTAIKLRSGVTLSLTYDAGVLSTIVDSFGRQISLSYDSAGRVAGMTDPVGGEYIYEYAANGNLIKVTYPDGSDREYLYRTQPFPSGNYLPHALIGIIDENEGRYATFEYADYNKAISSEHAGGADRVTLEYQQYSSHTVVTDALGTSRQYWFGVDPPQWTA